MYKNRSADVAAVTDVVGVPVKGQRGGVKGERGDGVFVKGEDPWRSVLLRVGRFHSPGGSETESKTPVSAEPGQRNVYGGESG